MGNKIHNSIPPYSEGKTIGQRKSNDNTSLEKLKNITHDQFNIITNDINQQSEYCNNFKSNMKGINNINGMLKCYKNIISEGKLQTEEVASGSIIKIDGFPYEIFKIDLNKLNKLLDGRIDIITQNNKTNFIQKETLEVNRNTFDFITDKARQQTRKFPTKYDMINLFKTLHKNYPGIIRYPARIDNSKGDEYNECAAFFMLLTKIYGVILLQGENNNMIKLFDEYRGFREGKNLTGQIIMIKDTGKISFI